MDHLNNDEVNTTYMPSTAAHGQRSLIAADTSGHQTDSPSGVPASDAVVAVNTPALLGYPMITRSDIFGNPLDQAASRLPFDQTSLTINPSESMSHDARPYTATTLATIGRDIPRFQFRGWTSNPASALPQQTAIESDRSTIQIRDWTANPSDSLPLQKDPQQRDPQPDPCDRIRTQIMRMHRDLATMQTKLSENDRFNTATRTSMEKTIQALKDDISQKLSVVFNDAWGALNTDGKLLDVTKLQQSAIPDQLIGEGQSSLHMRVVFLECAVKQLKDQMESLKTGMEVVQTMLS